MRLLFLGVIVAFFSLTQASMLYAQEFVTIAVKLNQVMEPKSITTVGQECANDPLCKNILSKAAQTLGVPPGLVSAALALIPKAERVGEEGRYTYQLPTGYKYCRSEIETVSVVPATGDRASVMSARALDNGIGVYTWTPRRGLGDGRSWVEANFTIIGVRDDLAQRYRTAGTCKPVGNLVIDCRGAKGVNKGKPACGTVRD